MEIIVAAGGVVPADSIVVKQDSTDGVIDCITGGVGSLIDGEGVNGREFFWTTVVVASAAFVGGSMLGRSRALNGKDPILYVIG